MKISKRNKLFILNILILLFTILTLFNIKINCYENNINNVNSEANSDAISLINNIVSYKLNETSTTNIQEFIDSPLTNQAGINSEWYTISLSQYGDYNFNEYEKSLINYIKKNEITSSVSKIKYALTLSSIGSTNSYISYVLDNCIGKQGIMSYIFGLHLLNNNYISKEYTKEELISLLLSLQSSDGGWSLSGNKSDVDVTAMTIQALSIYYNSNKSVKDSIEKSLIYLSNNQLLDGDYSSYGVGNPESTAQVLVALSSLNIDCTKDIRFIKSNNTILDGIKKYKLLDGSFSHTLNSKTNENSTVQVLYGLISYLRMCENKSPLYIFDNCNFENVKKDYNEYINNPIEINKEDNINIKYIIIIIIISVAIFICFLLVFLKKNNKKNYLFVLIITLLLVLITSLTTFSTPNNYYGEQIKKDNPIGYVNISIRCDTIVNKDNKDYIPKNGIILEVENWELEEGETVYDILIQVTKKYKIQIEKEGTKKNAYITGINYIYENQYGDLSGWMYFINNTSPSTGCGEYVLSPNDQIEWLYTCDLGNDLN